MALILVVDDHKDTRDVLCTILEEAGHEVLEAADGLEAVSTYRQKRPDLILLDIFMPHQDGIDTLVELRAESGDVKVIAISGGGSSGPLRLPPNSSALDPLDIARELGANMCLRKPLQISALLDAVNRVLADGA